MVLSAARMADSAAGLVYIVHKSLYVALTNKSNSTPLPVTRGPGFKMSSPFSPLPDGFEPNSKQIFVAVDAAWKKADTGYQKAGTQAGYESIVFAGLGEPTLKLDVLLDTARTLKAWRANVPLRLNTNGLGNVHWKRDIIGDLKTSGIESVTIALNAASPAEYLEIMKPTDGGASLEEVCDFAAACVEQGLSVECTAVEAPGVNIQEVSALAKSMGCSFRSRSFHPAQEDSAKSHL
mmetsp:Transcript_61766/g.145589  ORF Transcript_61766/g.145589 Transcript_61766/m.145589 type:complete len:236 (-) Transcript_61766:80-787(-)